ncbi:hypothetical protein SAMN04488020_102437 [Palleronia marisminoris]|uniref:Uncharacterized protein n=1 Tax=Palleronia marisminoris TaxID=315423 RepID=A0A1Y5RS21_9RHOB|nr:hypothetical protein [Palleronia marisminoris]SFG52020.1 hypothetical protein SAMN04488020_102437 [Palleronia marisminoris]SLN24116.1 hypothetical protein PAM7066_00844 [Palleronia marisminoris]
MAGQDMWNVARIERPGTGALQVTDGSNGARGGDDSVHGTRSAAFPLGIAPSEDPIHEDARSCIKGCIVKQYDGIQWMETEGPR